MSKEKYEDFTSSIIKFAEYFVQQNERQATQLDYSIESIEIIEQILDEAEDFYPEMNEKQKQNLIQSAGSYIFEVARKNFGGTYYWYDELDQPIFVTGQPDFEVSIVAFDKVQNRLENGKEDNISFYFKGYIEYVQNEYSGMIV